MEIKEIIKNARERLHIESLTPLQNKLANLPSSVAHVQAIAPTGSGKTLGFALAMLKRTKGATGHIESLVIAPTRELTLQIAKVLSQLAPKLRITAVYGGHRVIDESRSLEAATPDILVGTPGRILDHITRGRIDLYRVKTLVTDEYDKSLELGFQDEMRRIVRKIRRPQQIILTSATRQDDDLPEWLGANKPLVIDYSENEAEKPQIKEYIVKSTEADKLLALKTLLLRLPQERTIVFVNHRESAERVFGFISKSGFPTVLYHGALDQQDREMAVDIFTNGTAPIMIATDLAARGLDIPQVRSVIHYHSPSSDEILTHRNGRAGRMGAEGEAYHILAPNESYAAPKFTGNAPSGWAKPYTSLYFHAGKREKLSKSDILGALTGPGNLSATEVGLISLHDHYAVAAISTDKAKSVAAALNAARIKNRKIRVTLKTL